jgi:hypothetical protein
MVADEPGTDVGALNVFNHFASRYFGGKFALATTGTQSQMKTTPELKVACRFAIGMLALTGLAIAQDQAPHPWRAAADPAVSDQGGPDQAQPPQAPPPQGYAVDQAGPDQAGPNQGAPNQAPLPPDGPGPQLPTNYGPANYGVPPQLTIKQGTWTTVRTNQWLSSDRNQQGDTFTATLEQPLVIDGFVVAPRGSTVMGRVTEAKKAGRVEGTSRLGVELTGLTLADGQQVTIQSQMINRNGQTSVGRDAAAIGGTTAIGAAIGAGAAWGRGAAIGAGAGAAAGIIGVLLTRGRPTLIYPESVLTFQVTAPVTISTEHAPQAFQYVNTQQPQPYLSQQRLPAPYSAGAPYGTGAPYGNGAPPPAPYPGYGYGSGYGYGYPYPYAYGYPYPYYGGFGVVIGRGYGYYGGYRGFRR